MPLLNYTTEIDADKTCAEISKLLSKGGVQAVMTEYDPEGQYVIALSFRIRMDGRDISFRLPSDWRPVQEVLKQQKKRAGQRGKIKTDQAAAVRIAWRILKDWVEAQMALIETRMVTTAQVFLPYAVMKDGRTLSEHVESDPKFLLGEGS